MKKIFALFFLVSTNALAVNPCKGVPNSKPVFERINHNLKGCELISIAPNSIYEKLGLKAGDIVKPESKDSAKALELYSRSSTTEVR